VTANCFPKFFWSAVWYERVAVGHGRVLVCSVLVRQGKVGHVTVRSVPVGQGELRYGFFREEEQ